MEILKYRKDVNSPWQDVVALTGAPGKDGEPGKDGADGKDYVLTEADKQEIAQLAISLMPVAEDGEY